MYQRCILLGFLFTLFSCAATQSNQGGQNGADARRADFLPIQGNPVTVSNPTFFDVYFEGDQKVERGAVHKKIFLIMSESGLTGGFDVIYDVPLSASMSLFCVGDNQKIRKEEPSVTIRNPGFTVGKTTRNYGTWLKIVNNSKGVISVQSGGRPVSSWEQKGSHLKGNSPSQTNRGEFYPNEEILFFLEENGNYNNYSIRDGQANAPFRLSRFEKNYLYTVEYGGDKTVSLTDARPLTHIGEPTWSRRTPGAAYPPVFAEYGDRSVKVVASANSVSAITLNAAGEETASRSNQENNAGAVITALRRAEDAYITAGHTAGALSRSVVEKRSLDDTLIWTIPFRQKKGVMYARLYALAQRNETTYLAAGMAGSNGIDDGAYFAEVSDKGTKGEILWELSPEASKSRSWKTVRSISYNEKNDVYIAVGDCGGDNTFAGFIDTTGVIKSAGFVITNFLVAQALSDANGDFYVMGQEFRSGKSFAVVRKYTINGTMLWQQKTQLKENALYQCATFDEDAIVLGGVMDAADEYGGKGAPFLHSVDCKTGGEQWLSPIKIQGAAIVASLQKAIDYGFIAAFASVDSRGNWTDPQIVRLNARGKLINHKSY
jgi:hypothetical protein